MIRRRPARARRERRRRQLTFHWIAFGVVALIVLAAMAFDGFSRGDLARTGIAARGSPTTALRDSGPILDLRGDEVRSVAVPPRTVVLSFDDGPDPAWTNDLLAVLRRHRVPATFFVVGARVLRHPEIVRQALKDGHEIGVHTYTHVDLAETPAWRAEAELALSQSALAGAAGVSSSLLRLPYSSLTSSFDDGQYRAAREAAAEHGYLVVAATHDPQDWSRPGVDRMVAACTIDPAEGGILLFHDGGGHRAQTVAAVDQLIPVLKERGFRFATVADVAGLDVTTNPAISGSTRTRGLALLWAARASRWLTRAFTLLLVPAGALALLRGLVVVIFASIHRWSRRRRAPALLTSGPGVSVVVPAYNEAVGIERTVRSLAGSRYRPLEVIVVDDGSDDGTAAIVEGLGLPDVTVVRQANGGKAAALNAGLGRARHDLIVMVDGDTIFEPETIGYLVAAFDDPKVGAVSGNAKVGNRQRLLGRWQHIEYVLGFNLDRRTCDVLRCVPTVPGAVGAFRRAALEDAGGLSDDTIAEDTDVTIAVQRRGWRVIYEERAIAWTEAPQSLSALWRQRYRWSYGTIQSMWKHRRALRERRAIGLLGLPYLLLFQIVLPLLAPLADLVALYWILFMDSTTFLIFWGGYHLLQLAIGLFAFRLDRERPGPLWALPLQQFAYRQCMYLVLFQSVVTAVAGSRLGWNKLKRMGMPMPERAPAA